MKLWRKLNCKTDDDPRRHITFGTGIWDWGKKIDKSYLFSINPRLGHIVSGQYALRKVCWYNERWVSPEAMPTDLVQ